MAFYSDDDLQRIRDQRSTVVQKYHSLLLAYNDRPYKTSRAKEFATHGFLRRLGTLRRCIEQVFELLPLGSYDIPEANIREDATIALQAFIFNCFGCFDNLVWVWVEEKPVRLSNGRPLSAGRIGLGTRYVEVEASFSDAFRAYLDSMKEWFIHLENYRHALAHRIPLYIPPHSVSPTNQAAYSALEREINLAARTGEEALEADLRSRQRALMFFRPWMIHSFEEQPPLVVIHPQMLADFNTVDEFARRMLGELDALIGG
jgi:hypothetical protein